MAQTINDPQYYMTKEQYDSLMSALRLEFARRSGKNANGVSLNYPNLNGPLVTVWDENKFKPAVTVSKMHSSSSSGISVNDLFVLHLICFSAST